MSFIQIQNEHSVILLVDNVCQMLHTVSASGRFQNLVKYIIVTDDIMLVRTHQYSQKYQNPPHYGVTIAFEWIFEELLQ
jgi:hypothetical protein